MLIFLLVLLPILFLFLIHHLALDAGKLPPGPTLWQLWQKRAVLANKPHVALKELSEIHGPLLSLRLGGQLVVVASSPAMAEEIHKTNNLIFSGRYMPSLNYNVPGTTNASLSMARDCDASWKFLRGIAQNCIFSSKAVQSAAGIRKAKVMEMIKLLSTGRAVNIEHALSAAFINMIANVLASRDLFVGERLMRFLDEIVRTATVLGLADVFPIFRGFDFWSRGKSMEIYDRVKLIWGDIITQRRTTSSNSKKDFLDVLIGYSFDDDQLAMILMELLLAATDSTTITAVWLMAEIIKNPEILQRVRGEVEQQAVEGGVVKESRLSECWYLEACIKETLRLHVPGPFALPHRATKACKLGSYVIPKDSIVVVNAWAIHLDPGVWEDAAIFKPQRFLDSKIELKGDHDRFEFMPFGGGSRICPGWNVGVKGVQLVVASLLHHFDWSLPNGQNPNELDMTDKFGTSLKMEKPLYLVPTLREHVAGFEF